MVDAVGAVAEPQKAAARGSAHLLAVPRRRSIAATVTEDSHKPGRPRNSVAKLKP